MTLHLHRAERADGLVDELSRLLADPLPDPFAGEVVAVPTAGVERWLAQQLSQQLGICVGVEFPSVRRLVADALAAVVETVADDDPWQPANLVWPILEILTKSRGEQWAELVWRHIDRPAAQRSDADAGTSGARRWQTARHAADLFDQYSTARPELLLRWLSGESSDATGNQLPATSRWQPELWRRLRAEIGGPTPVERLPAALERLRQQAPELALPPRLSVFGLTRLDRTQRQVLTALSGTHDVHLWLVHPSPQLWGSLADRSVAPGPRSHDDSGLAVRNRLLAYLGRDARENQLLLPAAATDTLHQTQSPKPPISLLTLLQADISANRGDRSSAERPMLEPDDDSIQVHATHGPDRQAEVLREVLVGLLADDPTLEPRDIIVLCPDIERFAPYLSAVFSLQPTDRKPVRPADAIAAGSGVAEHPGHQIRVRLADRSLRRVNPLLAVLGELLELGSGRMTAAQVLDLTARPAVSRRFRFSPDDLERIAELVGESGVRWGLDAAHRAPYGLEQFGQNTWRAGLDRLLLGVAMDATDHHYIGTTLPLDEVDSSDVELIGRLAELIDRLAATVDSFRGPYSLPEWIERSKQAIDSLTTTPGAEGWQTGHAHRALTELVGTGAESAVLSRAEYQALLSDGLRARAGRANFRTGALTICTMYPMRSVPHRVVCLLGMDDDAFPRRSHRDGDDLLVSDPWIGDPDRRSEDRQLLLDAIMSATEHLVVVYTGADPRTGTIRAPAVPIGELLDTVERTVQVEPLPAPDSPAGGPVRARLLRQHPLQPFDSDNFGGRDRPIFSFDQAALAGARAAAGKRSEPVAVFSTDPLPDPVAAVEVSLEDLVKLLVDPAKALLRQRGQLRTWTEDNQPADQLPVRLDGLESWQIGNRILAGLLDGTSPATLAAAEWRRGQLPPRLLGELTLDAVIAQAMTIAEQAKPWLTEPALSYDIAIAVPPLPAGPQPIGPRHQQMLSGTVAGVRGNTLVTVSYSVLSARQRLPAFTKLLALTVAQPETAWEAVTIGRRGVSRLGPLDPGWAALVLADQLDLYRTGLSEPLPLAARTSAEYALLRNQGKPVDPLNSALTRLWERDRDDSYERLFGVGVTFAELVSRFPSRPEEERGTLAEPHRFGTLARRLFAPMLRVEELR